MNPTHHTLAVLTAAILVVSTDRVLAQADSIAPKLPVVWQTLKNHDKAIISPDGKTVAFVRITSGGGTTLHRSDTKNSFLTLPGCSESLTFFTDDSKHLILPVAPLKEKKELSGPTLGVFDITKGKRVREFDLLPKHDGNCLYTKGGKVLVAVGRDSVITAYNYATGECLGDFDNNQHRPSYMALSADGKWLLTAGGNSQLDRRRELRVWDVEKRKLSCELHDFSDRIGSVAISRDGKWCAASVGRRVWVFDRENRTEMGRISILLPPDLLLFAPNGETLLIMGEACHHGVNVWDWRKSKDVRGGTPKFPNIGTEKEEKEFFKKHNVTTLRDASIADDGTLLTCDTKANVRLWTFLNTKPKDTDPEVPKKDKAKK